MRELQTLPVEISCLTEDTTEVRLNFQNSRSCTTTLAAKAVRAQARGPPWMRHAPSRSAPWDLTPQGQDYSNSAGGQGTTEVGLMNDNCFQGMRIGDVMDQTNMDNLTQRRDDANDQTLPEITRVDMIVKADTDVGGDIHGHTDVVAAATFVRWNFGVRRHQHRRNGWRR